MLVDFKVCHTSSVRNVHFLTAARVLEPHRTPNFFFLEFLIFDNFNLPDHRVLL